MVMVMIMIIIIKYLVGFSCKCVMKSGRWRRRIYSSPQEVTSEAKVTFTAQLPVYNTHDRTTEYYKGAFKKITNTNSATKYLIYLIPYTIPVILLYSYSRLGMQNHCCSQAHSSPYSYCNSLTNNYSIKKKFFFLLFKLLFLRKN